MEVAMNDTLASAPAAWPEKPLASSRRHLASPRSMIAAVAEGGVDDVDKAVSFLEKAGATRDGGFPVIRMNSPAGCGSV